MTTSQAIRTIFEIVAVLIVTYGILHENKIIAFENKMAAKIKRIIRGKLK